MFASVPEGIPRDLAWERAAEISNLRYDLLSPLTPHTPTAEDREELRFILKTAKEVLLKFRDTTIGKLFVNATEIPAKVANGNIAPSADKLHVGERIVSV